MSERYLLIPNDKLCHVHARHVHKHEEARPTEHLRAEKKHVNVAKAVHQLIPAVSHLWHCLW